MKFWPFEPSIYVKEIYSKLQKIFTKQIMSDVERVKYKVEQEDNKGKKSIVLVSCLFEILLKGFFKTDCMYHET